MSVGAFIGIRPSFLDQARASAFLGAINRALRAEGLGEYHEPPAVEPLPGGPRLGRSQLDQHGAGVLMALGARAAEEEGQGEHMALLESNPYRTAFLPLAFSSPLETDYAESIAGTSTAIEVGSAPRLRQELIALAPALGIPLEDGSLSDETARRINAGESLSEDDIPSAFDDERAAWLMLYEGAGVALERGLALSLAG